MSAPRVLVAGIGNIFRSDDGFGSEVARVLATRPLPPGVRVRDYGIGGIHLAHDVASGVEVLVLVDTVPDAGGPGAVTVLAVEAGHVPEPDPDTIPVLDAHSMDPVTMLASVSQLGGELPRTFVVGCEPADLDEGIGLSDVVAAAVPVACRAVLEVVDQELSIGRR